MFVHAANIFKNDVNDLHHDFQKDFGGDLYVDLYINHIAEKYVSLHFKTHLQALNQLCIF